MFIQIFLSVIVLTLVGTGLLPGSAETDRDIPEGFVYVRKLIPDAVIEMRYAGTHNFTGKPVPGYEANEAILTCEAAGKLKEAADEFRSMGYRIKIFDAYRPLTAVRAFVKWAEDPDETSTKEEFYPTIRNKTRLLDLEYIARSSNHCKGSAVDLTLIDAEGNELDMGTCFDYFGTRAWHGAKDLTEDQERNRELLLNVMKKHGFKPFEREWWHYRLNAQPYPDTSFDFPVR